MKEGKTKIITVELEGITPLMMHAFRADQMTEKSRKQSKDLTKEEIAESYAHRDPETGELYIPGDAVWSCLIQAGRYVTFKGKKRISSQKESLLALGFDLIGDKFLLGTKEYIIDERAVVNPSTQGRSMCYRPKLEKWHFTVHGKVNVEEFSLSMVKDLFSIAGSSIGLLEFRPAKKGRFGQFKVISFTEIDA